MDDTGNRFVMTAPAALMKEEAADAELFQKRSAVEPELMLGSSSFRAYTCGNVQCPHGFLDRNARNAHQYSCKFNSPAESNKLAPSIFPATFEPPGQAVLGGLDLDVPVDGQRSLAELMDMYEANVGGAPRSLSNVDTAAHGVQFLAPCVFGDAMSSVIQQQQSSAFYVRGDAAFGRDVAAASPDLRFSSGLNAHYGGALQLQQPQAHRSTGPNSNWFY